MPHEVSYEGPRAVVDPHDLRGDAFGLDEVEHGRCVTVAGLVVRGSKVDVKLRASADQSIMQCAGIDSVGRCNGHSWLSEEDRHGDPVKRDIRGTKRRPQMIAIVPKPACQLRS